MQYWLKNTESTMNAKDSVFMHTTAHNRISNSAISNNGFVAK